MKLIIRSMLFSRFLILVFCLLPVYAEDASSPRSVMDMIPYESIAYVSLSDLDVVYHSVVESPEWQELLGIEQIEEQLDQARQVISFGPMLFGISVEEFLNAFGHKMVFSLMGMKGQMPIAGLIADVRSYREQAEYAVGQAATLPAIAGGAMVEEKEYRDVPFTAIGSKDIKIKYAFLDNYLIAGLGGGFEKLVDLYKGDGKSIKDSPNLQFMEQKVSLSSEICFYADLEAAVPILEMAVKIGSGEQGEENQLNAMMKQLALKSVKAFALSLSLSGQTQEVYLHLKPEDPNPITDLLLAPHSPMASLDLVPLADGALVGIHIGDPVELLGRGLKLAELLGVKTGDIEGGIKQLEDGLKLNLRDDLLSALTGEIAVMAMLPKEKVDLKKDKVQMVMQIAKVRQAVLIGVKDEKRLRKTVERLYDLVDLEPMSVKEYSYKGTDIHTEVLPLDAIAPGVALMPSYSFRDGLLIVSNKAEWVQDTINLLESSGAAEIQEKLSESRILLYVDAAGIADFAMKQEIIENIKPSEAVQDKLCSLGSIAASLSLGSDGAGIKLISTSEDNWTTKILRGVLIAIYANISSEHEETVETEM